MTEIVFSGSGLPQAPLRRAEANPYYAYLNSLPAEESRRSARGSLDRVAHLYGHPSGATVAWEALTPAQAAQIAAALQRHVRLTPDGDLTPPAPGYVNKHLSAVRQITRTCWRLGLIDAEQRDRMIEAVKSVDGKRLPPGRSIPDAEVAALRAVCDDSLISVRNEAIIAVLHATGMRRAELAGARRENYNPGEGELTVIGKRNRERLVYLNDDAMAVLGRWLSRIDRREGPLVCAITRWGKPVPDRHLSPSSIGFILEGMWKAAELPRMSPHDFRRSFIGDLLDSGVDMAVAQQLVGHANVNTTAKYDRRPARVRRAAAKQRKLPTPTTEAE